MLNPKNEEAIYNLAKLKLDSSDYKKSKELNEIKKTEKKLKIKLNYHKINNRLYDQKIFISDNKKIYKDLKWKPNIDYKKGLDQMLKWIKISKIYKNV